MKLPNGEAAQLGDKVERYCLISNIPEAETKRPSLEVVLESH